MSAGNWGVVENLIQGFLASEFLPGSVAQGDQGATASVFLSAVRNVATGAHLTQANIKIAAPQFFDGTNDVDLSSSAAILIGVVAQSTSTETEDEMVTFYNTTTPTEGTTRPLAYLGVPAGSSQATSRLTSVVFTTPVVFDTALSWSVVDNGSDADIEGTSLGTANGVKVMVVYAV